MSAEELTIVVSMNEALNHLVKLLAWEVEALPVAHRDRLRGSVARMESGAEELTAELATMRKEQGGQ